MEFISFPKSSIGSRWRPGNGAAPQLAAWRPTPPQLTVRPVQRTELGQLKPEAMGDVLLSAATSLGTAVVGFGLAVFGPKDATTWRWIGGLAGSIGVLRLLHDVSKSGI
jgi:hypothetical protein